MISKRDHPLWRYNQFITKEDGVVIYCVVTEITILHPHPVNSFLVQDVLENVVLLFLVSIVSALGEVCSFAVVFFSLFLFVWVFVNFFF